MKIIFASVKACAANAAVGRTFSAKGIANMYEYGYFVAGQRVVLGVVTDIELEAKRREINCANKIDAKSMWFVEAAQHCVQADLRQQVQSENSGESGASR